MALNYDKIDKGSLIYMDMEKDQDLFQGQGDYQFEIYRKMRKLIGKDWAASCPHTNVFVGCNFVTATHTFLILFNRVMTQQFNTFFSHRSGCIMLRTSC